MSDFSLGATSNNFPIVFVHGYEVYEGGQLGALARAVCETTKRLMEMNGDLRAVFLGGWHLKEAGTWTIADAMVRHLVDGGISPKRMITRWQFESLDGFMPPRDSWEELVLLKLMLQKMGISFKAPLQSVAWDFHIPRLTRMYRTCGLTDVVPVSAVPEPYEGLRRRMWMERAARAVRFIDPHGGGIICHETRLSRTLDNNLKPLIP